MNGGVTTSLESFKGGDSKAEEVNINYVIIPMTVKWHMREVPWKKEHDFIAEKNFCIKRTFLENNS